MKMWKQKSVGNVLVLDVCKIEWHTEVVGPEMHKHVSRRDLQNHFLL